MSYWSMRRRIELMKKASGLTSVDIPDEVITLESSVNKAKAELNRLRTEKASEGDLAKAALVLGSYESRMRALIMQKKLA